MEEELLNPELNCHTLYPVQKTTRFIDKNNLSSTLTVVEGMTGQVKESVIMRRMELDVRVKDGYIHFDPWFLSDAEFDANEEIRLKDNRLVFSGLWAIIFYVKSCIQDQ